MPLSVVKDLRNGIIREAIRHSEPGEFSVLESQQSLVQRANPHTAVRIRQERPEPAGGLLVGGCKISPLAGGKPAQLAADGANPQFSILPFGDGRRRLRGGFELQNAHWLFVLQPKEAA